MRPDQLFTAYYKTKEHAWFKNPTALDEGQTTLSRTITMYLFGEGKSPSDGGAPDLMLVMDETVSSIMFHPIVFEYKLSERASDRVGIDLELLSELAVSEKTFKQPFSDELIRAWLTSIMSRYMKESYMGEIILSTPVNLYPNGYRVGTTDLIRIAVQDETIIRPYSVQENNSMPQQRGVDLFDVVYGADTTTGKKPGIAVQNPLRELNSLIQKDADKYNAKPTIIHFKRTPSHPGQMDSSGYYEVLVAYTNYRSDEIKQMVHSAIVIFTGNNDVTMFNEVKDAFYTLTQLGRGITMMDSKQDAHVTLNQVARLLLTFTPSKLVEHLQLADHEYATPKTPSATLHNALVVAVTALCNVFGQPDTIESN